MAVPAMTSHSMTSPHTNGCHVPMAMGVCTQVHTGGFVERTLDSLLEPFFLMCLWDEFALFENMACRRCTHI